MTTDQQPTIDFESLEHRGNQLRLIGAIAIPPDGVVSAARTKAVLRTIDDYCRGRRGWPSEETIAMQANVGKRTVARAVKRLQELRILAVQKMMSPSGHVQNVYSIVWPELAAIVQAQSSKPSEFGCGKPVETPAERGATDDERGASQAERGASQAERGASVAPYTLRNDKETLTSSRAGPDQKASQAKQAEISAIRNRPSTTEPVDIDPADIAEATRMLVDAGWDDRAESTARDILRRGYTLDHLWELVATYLANQHRFRSPGAIWDRCERGSWAVGGIRKLDHAEAAEVWASHAVAIDESERIKGANERHAANQAERKRRYEIASTIRYQGMRAKKDYSEIEAELEREGLTWSDGDPP